MDQAKEVWDGFEAARGMIELQPPSSRRALVRFQEPEEAERVRESALEKSFFVQFAKPKVLIYVDRSCFSIQDEDGNRQPQTVNMTHFSVSTELPKGTVFDPVGTEWFLESLRDERKETE